MASDDTLKAKMARALHRNGLYEPAAWGIEKLVSRAGMASEDHGRAKELAHEMARDEACPVIYKRVDTAVMLEKDTTQWVAAYVRRHDKDQLTWDLEDELG